MLFCTIISNLHLCSFNEFFFNSFKEIKSLSKEINRLLSKGMSNIYLTVTFEKKWRTHNFHFKSLKSSLPDQFLGNSNSRRYHWIFKLLVATEKSGLEAKLCVAFLLFLFWKELWRFKVKDSIFLLKKNLSLIKPRLNRKWTIPHAALERWTMYFTSSKNSKLKVKLSKTFLTFGSYLNV